MIVCQWKEKIFRILLLPRYCNYRVSSVSSQIACIGYLNRRNSIRASNATPSLCPTWFSFIFWGSCIMSVTCLPLWQSLHRWVTQILSGEEKMRMCKSAVNLRVGDGHHFIRQKRGCCSLCSVWVNAHIFDPISCDYLIMLVLLEACRPN